MLLDTDMLDDIIDEASAKTLQKGRGLANRKKVFDLKYDEGKNEISGKVYSESYGGIYEVEIDLSGDWVEGSCTCPYDWESNCKHIVAVALAAKQQLIVQPLSLPVAEREIIVRIPHPWVNNLIRYAPGAGASNNIYYLRNQYKIEITGLLNTGLVLQLSHKSTKQSETIKIETEETQLVITGTGIARKDKLSNNMWLALSLLEGEIGSFRNMEDFMVAIYNLKHDFVDPMLKDYTDYVDEKDLTYAIQNNKPGILFKDKSLILPVHLKDMLVRGVGNILSNHYTYNQHLLPGKAPSEDWGYGFYMIRQQGPSYDLTIDPMQGKWNKEHNEFKSNLTALSLKDGINLVNADNAFIQLAIECQKLQRYKRYSHSRINSADDASNSELFQAFSATHQTLLGLIQDLGNYPFYITDYTPNYTDGAFRKNDSYIFNIEKEPLLLKLNCSDGKKYFECEAELLHKDETLDIRDIEFVGHYFVKRLKGNTLYHLPSATETWLLFDLIEKKKFRTPLALKTEFINNYLMPVSKRVMVTYQGKSLVTDQVIGGLTQTRLYLSELGEYILFQPHVVYGQHELELFSGQEYVKDEANNLLHITRQTDAESELKAFFISLHPEFAGQESRGFLYLHHKEMLRNGWFMDLFAKLNEHQVETLGFNKLSKLKYNPNRPSINISVGSGIDWFDIKIKVEFGNQVADLSEVRKAVLRKEQYVTLKDGSIGILPQEWLEKYSRYFGAGAVKKDSIQISKFHFTLLDDFDDDIIDVKTLIDLREKRKRLKEFEAIKEVEVPKTLKATLRDYQQHGLAWLNFLDEFGWGGCLADDMGLGKTIQCIAFLLQQIKKNKAPNLVIMPTTLLFNWEQELKKFAPSIKYHVHYGAEREEEILKKTKAHLVLTSYGIMLRDIETFKEINFNYIILDESQAIKNPASQRYKAVRMLQARNRLAMSGTPVENNTMELYSQFNFLNPGIFGAQESFRKDYAGAIDKEGNVTVAEKLRRLIKPFIIRRTKEQVAKELPGKSEMTLYCEMGVQQRKVYEAYKEKIRKELLEKIETEGMNKARFAVLDGLLKLRQICNSPALLNTKEDYGSDSIKIEELLRSIKEKTGQHKVLVFSQFVGMLGLIREKLDEEKITYEYLDGQSRKRKESVENFQQNEDCRVFLISLKAGGTGLNLTAADYVYIVDPWWNPAVEDQAIDRTYRIGQDKKVFAYRMICHNTIEEKILLLQEKKKKVAKDIIGTDDGFVKALSKDDVMDLLM